MGTLLIERGIPPAVLPKNIGLPGSLLLDTEAWIDRRWSLGLALELARLTGDDLCGLHAGERIRFQQYGAWGFAICSAPTLGDALSVAARDVREHEMGTRIDLISESRLVRLSAVFEGDLEEDPRAHYEGNLMFLRKILDLAVEPVAAEACLSRERPRNTDELERLLGPRLRFRAAAPTLVFDRDALSLPLRPPPAWPRVYGVPPSDLCETAGAVFRVLRQSLDSERPTITFIADSLSLRIRTLQRRLARWGLTFEEVLDEYRERRAIEYLKVGRYSITEIAFRLGYSDAAHFTRAFRRWTGVAPYSLLKPRGGRSDNARSLPFLQPGKVQENNARSRS
jgi:AraC-like DNA-binding protein